MLDSFVPFAPLILIGLVTFILLIIIIVVLKNYRRCPPDKVMVIYGKTSSGEAARCIHGGAAFVWPIFQDYQYLDLTPFSLNIDLRGALSKQNIRVDVPSSFTVAISTEPSVMKNAAERLLGLPLRTVQNLASEIILGQLRLIVATMEVEELNTQRLQFLREISIEVKRELKQLGLKLINCDIVDVRITDDKHRIVPACNKASVENAQSQSCVSNHDIQALQAQLTAFQAEMHQLLAPLATGGAANAPVIDILDAICNGSTYEAAEKLRKLKENTAL